MEALLKFLFVVVVIYYGLRLFIRYAAPWLIARFMKKQASKFSNMRGFQNENFNQSQEGEVKVKPSNTNKSKEDDKFGEYVDFEDISE